MATCDVCGNDYKAFEIRSAGRATHPYKSLSAALTSRRGIENDQRLRRSAL